MHGCMVDESIRVYRQTRASVPTLINFQPRLTRALEFGIVVLNHKLLIDEIMKSHTNMPCTSIYS